MGGGDFVFVLVAFIWGFLEGVMLWVRVESHALSFESLLHLYFMSKVT